MAGDPPRGIGHNGGPPLGEPPKIPLTKPTRSGEPSAFLRAAAIWIGQAIGLGIPIATYMAELNDEEWIKERKAELETYRDPPQTLQDLQDAVDTPRAGTERHHIAEQTPLERLGFGKAQIDTPDNLVRIPTLKHYQVSTYYRTPNDDFGGLTPHQYLADKTLDERRRVGLKALIKVGVLRP